MSHNADSNYGQQDEFTFECHLFDAARRAKKSGLDITASPMFAQFNSWMDAQLANLERRFDRFTTPNSNRGYFSR